MGITASQKGGQDFDVLDEGVHRANCVGLIDLGHQENEKFNKLEHKVLITWELPEARIQLEKDGEVKDLPRFISRTFTLSLHKKSSLRPFLQNWRGKKFEDSELEGFDMKNILSVSCNLQIIHDTTGDKTYANISGIMPDKGKVETESELSYFSFEEKMDIPPNCPEWIVEKIKNSGEWTDMMSDEMPQDPPWADDDDKPF